MFKYFLTIFTGYGNTATFYDDCGEGMAVSKFTV